MPYVKQSWNQYDKNKSIEDNISNDAVLTPAKMKHIENGFGIVEQDFSDALTVQKETITEDVNQKLLANKNDNDQTFGTYNGRITKLESDYAVLATNLIKNGDFSNGSVGWTSYLSATLSVENGKLKITPSSSGYSGVIQNRKSVINNLSYIKAKIIQNTGSQKNINIQTTSASSLHSIPSGVETTISKIYKETTLNNNLFITKDSSSDVFDFYISYVINIDLTATFGASNEPTATQMDRLLTQFPNSWFDGTKNLFLARWALNELFRQDRDKANIKQNEWITPPLLNGWTKPNEVYQEPQYRMNNFGDIEIRGSAMGGTSGIVFKLPTGYRPKKYTFFTSATTLTGGETTITTRTFYVSVNGDIYYYITGVNTYIHFGTTKFSID